MPALSSEDVSTIVQLLSGPASSVGVCILVGWAAWKLLVDRILPQSEARFDKLMEEHGKDRDAFREAVKHISERITKVEDDVTDIKNKLGA
jgi:hypothetical protein